MEPLLDIGVLKEIFRNDTRVGNLQEYVDRVSKLHHRYLESQLLSDTSAMLLNFQELADFAEDAEFLANEYTNPLVIDRIEGLPIENVPSRQIAQDALAVAGTIFEFLGDIVSSWEERLSVKTSSHRITTEGNIDERLPSDIKELYARVGQSGLLYLKAALCYGLGMYEPRTGVILKQLLIHLPSPAEPLTLNNIEKWSEHLVCALLSRDIGPVLQSIKFVRGQIVSIQQQLRQFLISEDLLAGYERMSLRKVAAIQTSLSLINACILQAEAFLRGSTEKFEQAQKHFNDALMSVQHIHEYQLEWIIRTLQKVTVRMWADSPWIRLGNVIPRRAYLKSLVEEGIVTLWSSQVAALEMQSRLGPLAGGYLDDRIKRVVIHMPTSAGKTLLAQFAVAHQAFSGQGKKCVYVGFSRALCDQVAADLARRLSRFNIRVTALVSDNELLAESYEGILLGQSTVIAVTPEKLSHLLRQRSSFLEDTALFIFDELHNISKVGRGWTYEELISLILQHPSTRDAKVLFLSAVMPNHLTVQEWVDPERLSQTIDTAWQPTRTLKGVVRFPLEKPSSQEIQTEVTLSGDLVYVRRKEDINSPLRINNFIQTRQVLRREIPVAEKGKPSWTKYPRWKRIHDQSEDDVSHAAKAAARFARLGPVLVYCPTQAGAVKLCDLLVHMPESSPTPLEEGDEIQYRETVEFVKERLSNGHPLVTALQHRVAFHHGDLPRDVRNEIEFAFQERWIRIMASTTTLAEGVNFPIKTLLLSHYGIPGNDDKGKWGIQHPLSKRDFKNIVGRAGRALYETEGQVVFIQSIIGYPWVLDTGFEDYLHLEPTSPELFIRSTLDDTHLLEALSSLVDAVDNGTLTEEQLLFEARPFRNDEERKIARMVDRLQTFTLLLQEQNLTGEDEESFVRIFQGTFLGKQRPDLASQVLGPFSHRSAQAIRSQLSLVERSLFAQTGLKILTCRNLMNSVRDYWEQKRERLSTFLNNSLDEDILYEVATIIYSLNDAEVDPKPVKLPNRISFDHARFFNDWILLDPDWTDRHFLPIKDITRRAQIYTDYIYDTLEYKAPWTLSAFWLFSKTSVEAQYGLELIKTSLGKELVLLPAYAKFGVNTPAAALFSTLGISPARLARQLASLYETQHAQPEDRFNYPQILQWFLNVQSHDLAKNNFKPTYIHRVLRLLDLLTSSDDESTTALEGARVWERSFWIAGWQYYRGESIIQTLRKGSTLLLRREPSNRINPDAVEILTQENVKLGYVPDKLAKEVAKQVDIGSVKVMVSKVNPSATPQNKVYIHCWVEEL